MKKTLLITRWLSIYCAFLLISTRASADWVEIFEDDFESGEISLDRWNPQTANPQEGITLAQASHGDPVRTGNFGVAFRLALTDPVDENGKRRSELRPRRFPAEQAYHAGFQQLHRYEFSMRLPEDWQPDSPEVVAQWHGTVDRDISGSPLEPRRSPPVSLRMTFIEAPVGSGNYLPAWDARVRWDDNQYTAFDMSTVTSMNLIDPMDATNDLGVWVDWVFEIRWDWDPAGVGEVRVYKNDVLVADYQGPNAFRDDLGPNSKIGLYKWDWDHGGVLLRTAHYDDVHILIDAEEVPSRSWPAAALLTISLLIAAQFPIRRLASPR